MALALATGTLAQAQVVTTDSFDYLELRYETPQISSYPKTFDGRTTNVLDMEGYLSGGEYGAPALPVKTDLITIPFCQSLSVEVSDAVYDTLDLNLTDLYPLQPSRSKSQREDPAPVIDSKRYALNEFWGLPLASVDVLGVARDRRVANLVFSPVRVNPVTGQAIVCRMATVKVRYINADVQGTIDHYNRYYSPAFTVGQTLNRLFSTKDISTVSPLRMVIMAPGALRCNSLERFADWKRKQGMLVDLVYTTDLGLSSNTSIANYLQGLYTDATPDAPAPTFLILVGDHTNLRAFDTRLTSSSWWVSYDHISDLYFTTWTTGDHLPDCYSGRFSATDTTTLASIVNKTLYYETYAFSDDSYLGRAVLISGIDGGGTTDNDNAYRVCDPTMDYIASLYINADNGFNEVKYYKNNTSRHPAGVTVTGSSSASGVASTLRNLYSSGMGWINYSAHGNWNEWSIPSFTVNNVNNMSNNGKPSIMIGNCCLSNKFDMGVCFGESLLRRANNAGAVAYFGATNSTYWDEDFFWSVGIRNNIRNAMTLAYNSSKLGMYDRLFHTHGEDIASYAVTTGSMLNVGNMSVNSASSSQLSDSQSKLYYWEIYELMGDPSLLPWLGTAEELTASVARHNNNVTVNVPPYAYVAFVDSADHSLVAAAFANQNGVATLPIAASADLAATCLSVTAQGYKPYFKAYGQGSVGVDLAAAAAVSVSPNPATTAVTVSAEGLRQVELLDLMGRTLATQTAVNGTCQLPLHQLNAGLYLLRLYAAGDVTVQKLIVNK